MGRSGGCGSSGSLPGRRVPPGFGRHPPAAAQSLHHLLRNRVSQSGPPPGEPLCKHLGDGVYEFRKQPKGKKLRVLWFYGGTSIIVCTAAFTKAERTPRIKVEQLKFLRRQYWAALSRGEVEILDHQEEER